MRHPLDLSRLARPYSSMEISEGHARELAKQAARKAALREECLEALNGVGGDCF